MALLRRVCSVPFAAHRICDPSVHRSAILHPLHTIAANGRFASHGVVNLPLSSAVAWPMDDLPPAARAMLQMRRRPSRDGGLTIRRAPVRRELAGFRRNTTASLRLSTLTEPKRCSSAAAHRSARAQPCLNSRRLTALSPGCTLHLKVLRDPPCGAPCPLAARPAREQQPRHAQQPACARPRREQQPRHAQQPACARPRREQQPPHSSSCWRPSP